MDGLIRIYLSWPPDQFMAMIKAAERLSDSGHVPIMQSCSTQWTYLDRKRVEACDCLVRFSGESTKADFAVDCAKVLGLPVYFSLQACLDDLPKRAEVA